MFPGEEYNFNNNPRGMLFRAKLASWMGVMNFAANFGEDFTPFTPGLETKFAIEEALNAGSDVIYGGR